MSDKTPEYSQARALTPEELSEQAVRTMRSLTEIDPNNVICMLGMVIHADGGIRMLLERSEADPNGQTEVHMHGFALDRLSGPGYVAGPLRVLVRPLHRPARQPGGRRTGRGLAGSVAPPGTGHQTSALARAGFGAPRGALSGARSGRRRGVVGNTPPQEGT